MALARIGHRCGSVGLTSAGSVLATRHVTITREAGALSELPRALDSLAAVHLFAGELAAAASLVEEVRTVCEATGTTRRASDRSDWRPCGVASARPAR